MCALQKVAPKGVDVVYDPVGGKSFEEALKVVKWGAQILIIGFASGDIPKVRHTGVDVTLISKKLDRQAPSDLLFRVCKYAGMNWQPSSSFGYLQSLRHGCTLQIPANIALVKNLTLHGVFWGSYMQNNPRVLQQSLMELVSWLDEGRITVPVSHRYKQLCMLTDCLMLS